MATQVRPFCHYNSRKSKLNTRTINQTQNAPGWVNTVLSETRPHKPYTGGKPHQDCHRLHHSHIDRQYHYHQSLSRIINISGCSRRSSSTLPATRHTKQCPDTEYEAPQYIKPPICADLYQATAHHKQNPVIQKTFNGNVLLLS